MRVLYFVSAVALLVLGNIWSEVSADEDSKEFPVIETEFGPVRGKRLKSNNGRDFYAFRGVPYAKPPVGNLRFKEPEDPDPWVEAFDATKEGPVCIQYEPLTQKAQGVEDCLRVNIYTPRLNVAQGMLPVMVYVHGGGFVMGNANGETGLYGPNRFLDRDVILVTFTYRLEIMGFLSTEDAKAPGNYGLLDQTLALKWVKNNILRFGGNPYSVTLFGESAGAASVEFQLLSPRATDLFQRAIAQSGSAKCPWALHSDVGQYTKQVAKAFNCPTDCSGKLLECLRKQKAQDLVTFRKTILYQWGNRMSPIAFGPRIDAERDSPFLPADPHELIVQRRFNSVPFLTGLNANEGAYLVAGAFGKGDEAIKAIKADPAMFIMELLGIKTLPNGREIAQKAHDRYLSAKLQYEDQLLNIENMISDYMFFKNINEAALLINKYGDQPIYYYYYNHLGEHSIQYMLAPRGAVPALKQSVCHGDEIFLMFSNPLFKLTRDADKNMSSIMLDYWTSFAGTGQPTSPAVKAKWEPMAKRKRYFQLELEKPRMVSGEMPFAERMQFWNELIGSPTLIDKDEL